MEIITIEFDNPADQPAKGYVVKYRQVGTMMWTYLSENPSASPIQISVPDGKAWEGTIQAQCSDDSFGQELSWEAKKSACPYSLVPYAIPQGINNTSCDDSWWFMQLVDNNGSEVVNTGEDIVVNVRVQFYEGDCAAPTSITEQDLTLTIPTGSSVSQDHIGATNPNNIAKWIEIIDFNPKQLNGCSIQ